MAHKYNKNLDNKNNFIHLHKSEKLKVMKKMLLFAIIIAIAVSCTEKGLDIYNPYNYQYEKGDTLITVGVVGVGVTNFMEAIYVAEAAKWRNIGYIDIVLRRVDGYYDVVMIDGKGEFRGYINTYYILEGGTRDKFTIIKNDLNLKLIYSNIPLKELIDKLIN